MAHLFPDCLGEVDVVANAENIKCLLKLPYASNCSISMMVHRIGNTLLIDDFDVNRFLLQQEDYNWTWLRSFICEHILTRLNDTERNFLKNQPTTSSRNDAAVQQRSLLSKFLYHSLSTATVSKSELNDALDIKLAANQSAKHLQYGPLLPEPNVEENVPDPKHTKHTYNRNVVWTFEDIRMLIGTDMAIFGGASRPCISLRLRDMRQPINVLTGIDYWLDNLMCNVPEVVMCYHLDGLVQKYEIIKTEDLPFMENSKFQPNVIRNVAQNILSFLKQNATKSGHTYWLFKGRKDDVVKLYDLTSLMKSATSEFGAQASKPSKRNDCDNDSDAANQETDDKNPFTVPVAMLLYKVARNMKNSNEPIKAKQAGSIKALLDNCIKLLKIEEYPQIVASSYYLLTDLHIPSGTDPMSPKFDNEKSKDSSDDDDDDDVENNGSDDSTSTNEDQQQQQQQPEQQCTTKKVWSENSNTLPPPLSGTVDERCSSALQYIADGLNCLQYFSMNEAKLAKEREEIEKQTEKMRIIQEEQNPNMAKPYQAIPLPYEKIQQNLDAEGSEAAGSVTIKEKSKKEPSSSGDQLFVGKPRPPVVQSWNVHLKLLFFEKSCLIYAILTEQAYQRKEYGTALKYISIAMKYYDIVSMHQFYCMSVGRNYRTNLLARAGDCYFKCAQDFANINKHLIEYSMRRTIDEQIEKELEKDEKESPSANDAGEIQLVKPVDNLEQLILVSISYYETALKYTDGKGSRDEILGRIGSVLNELGIKYMNWSQEQYQKLNNATPDLADPIEADAGDDAKKPEPATDVYLSLAIKSYNCLLRGIAIFEEIDDNSNLAILLCNMGRFMRFRAHLERDKGFAYKKTCYENAFTSYQRALAILESKKQNPYLWDLVTWELSTGKFTLAKYMALHVHPGREVNQSVFLQILINCSLNVVCLFNYRMKRSIKKSSNC